MRFPSILSYKNLAPVAAAFAVAVSAQAGETAPEIETVTSTDSDLSLYDRIWALPVLYKNDNNPVLQEFALQGRMHIQYATGDSDQGEFSTGDTPDARNWGDFEVRRWRLGFKSKWFNVFKLEGQININPEVNPFYGNLYDLYLQYSPMDQFSLGVGKTKVKFTKEQEISSKEILTIERSLLSNQLFPGELTGAWVGGKDVFGKWFYEFGVYADDIQREFSEFRDGAVILGKLGYDFSEATGLESAALSLHYMNNTEPSSQYGSRPYEHNFSLTSDFSQGRWGFTSDFTYATGDGAVPDVWGVSLIPSVYLFDGLQLVARYQFASADGNDGLRVQSRYERLAPTLTDGGRGDEYQAGYVGLNYYLYGHKLKLMTGVEYASMNGEADGGDYDGWTWFTGVRMFF